MLARFIWSRHSPMKHSWVHRAHMSPATSALTLVLLATGACTPVDSSKRVQLKTADHPPIQLTAFVMDRISAAGVSVEMDSSAMVSGQFGQADTDVMTGIVGLGPNVIGYGFGSGEAVACCGDDSEVQLDMTASGAGDYVFAETHTAYGGNGITKFGVAQGIVLALSGPSREALESATRDYVSQLALAPPSTRQPRTGLLAPKAAQ